MKLPSVDADEQCPEPLRTRLGAPRTQSSIFFSGGLEANPEVTGQNFQQ